MTPKLTNKGVEMLTAALAGQTLTFTKMQFGNGVHQPGEDISGMTSLGNVFKEVSDLDLTTEETSVGYACVGASFSNEAFENGIRITEVGLFATIGTDTTEYLYAAGITPDAGLAAYIPSEAEQNMTFRQEMLVFISDSDNVVIVERPDDKVSNAAFNAHTGNVENPHGVTKNQVGLGNVPDVDTNDQTPTYESAYELADLTSGEKLSAAFGKLRLAVSKLIDHLKSADNPHGVTYTQTGAAPSEHTHSTAEINSGTLPIERGGTGTNNLQSLAAKLLGNAVVCGAFTGNGGTKRFISLGFTPRAVLVLPGYGVQLSTSHGIIGGLAVGDNGVATETQNEKTWNNSSTAIAITSNGFYVNYLINNTTGNVLTNKNGETYRYMAIR